MDEVRNDGRSPNAKTHCDLYLGGRGRRARKPPSPSGLIVKETQFSNEPMFPRPVS